MNNEETVTLPLSPTQMVEFFKNKHVIYEIDYESSIKNLKNDSTLLRYIANLNIQCNINAITPELMVEYFKLSDVANIINLNKIYLNILFYAKYGQRYDANDDLIMEEHIQQFIIDNPVLVVIHDAFLNSIPLYVFTRPDLNKDLVKQFIGEYVDDINYKTVDNTVDELGFSILTPFNNGDFMLQYFQSNVAFENQIYFTRYFDEYMFNGKNLFFYFENENNSYFKLLKLLTNVNSGDIEAKENLTNLFKLLHGTNT